MNNKVAIILFNLGGPDKLSAIRGFLFNLFNDKAIINLPQPLRFLLAKLISARREKKAIKIYEKMGGKSPILEITQAQAHCLEKELSFYGDFKVFVAMRYADPRAAQVVHEVSEYNPKKIILLPLYPQFSTATTASSFEEFEHKVKYVMPKIALQKICCYPLAPEFIVSHAKLIKQVFLKSPNQNLNEIRFLFSAHGLPQKLIDQGDPYVFHVEKTTNSVTENFANLMGIDQRLLDFKVCYQSKVGPLQWTGPSLEHEIRRCALDKKIPLIVPISFVSEHSETLVELDIDYKNLADEIGLKHYLRVPALNADGHFIKALTDICLNAVRSDATCFSGCEAKRVCGAEHKKCGFALTLRHCEPQARQSSN